MPDLPIEDVLPDLTSALRDAPEAVLQAPTGAGKTTRVPLALLGEEWLGDQKLIMLEPRRLAARSAARFMAKQLGEEAGQTVGYRVRMDTQVGRQTQIEVVTEGVLTRMLQDDPALEGVGAVLFDEFHERNLQADLGLALTLQTREVFRPELRVLVMSATLDTGPIAELLDAPLIESEGRSYPVEVHYRDRPVKDRIEPAVASKVKAALKDTDGDVLVFLPGAGEIRRTKSRLEDSVPDDVDLYPLFGNLPPEKQDRAIEPSPEGRRKVVIATDIAETSLTIEGVRVVVDSGLRRAPRFDASSGMTRLETVKISQASADQRKGRAGRVAPGVCYRLWTERTHHHLDRHTPPEIENADLASLALELATWGTPNPSDLRWLDPPPADAYDRARTLLQRLGAVDDEGQITDHGREMSDLGLHPRLAHMLINAQTLGHGALACDLAALLSERDIFKGQGEAPDVDLRLRLEALHRLRRGDRPTPDHARNYVVPYGAVGHVRKVADHWRSTLGVSQHEEGDIEACGLLTAFAYPDRLAQQIESGRFRLRNGQVAELPNPQLLSDADYLVAAHVDGRRQTNRIFLAAPLSENEILDYFGDQIEPTENVAWDEDAELVRARRRDELGALVLKDGPIETPDPTAMAEAMIEGVRKEGLDVLPWTDHARQLQHRIQFLHHHLGDNWPDVTDAALLDTLADWLLPHVYDMKRAVDLQQLNLPQILRDRLSYEQRDRLESWAPTHIEVPSGFDRPIDYSDPETPVLAVRLQEMFGQTETPRIAGGQVPLTLHLLSPAQRPVQITQDLAHFWEDTYYDVRKDMRGRYSKHYWPEDPLNATPTHTTKAQMEADV
ncbi:ATP-dependent helicase HrpB [Salinibacter sp. 10B]|uniref:ATP-dependent helicase HrpB n=1 Tax=Salinibacter sp. 10B TaxID=1923971 RepID=UPI000CF3BA7C|nr:ATP-dependent helicase HrpB [Salinibacter sp. 10B]PQJ34731.1 ATP-dependent helicase HrpB [Salinibacter sp. 10B]